jgi:superoxide reductase
MERRTFLSSALAGAAGIAIAPRMAGAADKPDLTNVIFTETDPGHWKSVEKLHVPLVEIQGRQISVTTPHPMSEAHYIVSHTVVLEGGNLLGRKTFNWKDSPTSKHELPAGYKGKITVTSTCNQHDWWLKELSV